MKEKKKEKEEEERMRVVVLIWCMLLWGTYLRSEKGRVLLIVMTQVDQKVMTRAPLLKSKLY